jgi:hypothetical protein
MTASKRPRRKNGTCRGITGVPARTQQLSSRHTVFHPPVGTTRRVPYAGNGFDRLGAHHVRHHETQGASASSGKDAQRRRSRDCVGKENTVGDVEGRRDTVTTPATDHRNQGNAGVGQELSRRPQRQDRQPSRWRSTSTRHPSLDTDQITRFKTDSRGTATGRCPADFWNWPFGSTYPHRLRLVSRTRPSRGK